jgi:hypothetical protein
MSMKQHVLLREPPKVLTTTQTVQAEWGPLLIAVLGELRSRSILYWPGNNVRNWAIRGYFPLFRHARNEEDRQRLLARGHE